MLFRSYRSKHYDHQPASPWYTAEMAAQYLNTNAKTIRRLWAMGVLRFTKPDIGVMQTRKEWMDEYMENCEIKADLDLDRKIDKIVMEGIINA